MNHPFIDGNKRIGAAVLDTGLRLNGIHLKLAKGELAKEFYDLAAGEIDYQSFLTWVRSKID